MASPEGERNTPLVLIKGDYRYAKMPDALLLDREVSDRARCVWMLLSRIAWQKRPVFPTRGEMAKVLDVNVRSIDRALAELEAQEWLTRKQRGFGFPNDYVLDPTPIHASESPSLESILAGIRTDADSSHDTGVAARDDTDVALGATQVSRPTYIESTSSSKTAPAKNRPVRRERKAWPEREPDEHADDGNASMHRSKAKPPRRRVGGPDSASGLAKTFEVLARDRFTRKQLAFGQFNQEGTSGAINSWLDEGVPADTIRAMIKIFLTEPFSDRAPLWKMFLAARHRLAAKTEKGEISGGAESYSSDSDSLHRLDYRRNMNRRP